MKVVSLDSTQHLAGTPRPGLMSGIFRRALLGRLRQIDGGTIAVLDGENYNVFGIEESSPELSATITVHDARFYSDIAFGGSIGAGESWMLGRWDCDDLVALVRILLRNRALLENMEGGGARATRPLQRLYHRLAKNTRRGAKRNIAAHYDLGNDFFQLWLDDSMMYSCGIFETAESSLADAQQARLDRVCRHLDLGPDDHLVEIGTGWGGLAIHAATHYGCRVTTTTISQRQYDYARRRVAAAGLEDRITLLMEDYRDLAGQFDKLISLEMIEAIGADQYDSYFAKCENLLRPGGRMLIQAITIEDDRFEEYRKGVDFIQRYIFPGSCLPSVRVMRETIGRVSDLRVIRVDDIGLHYATTLNHWRRNFFARIQAVRALGYPEAFLRMWEYYFCYCEGGFLEQSISDVHLVAERPVA